MTSRIIDDVDFSNLFLDVVPKAAIDEVIRAIKAAPNSGKLDVRGNMGLTGSIYKYDTITFDNNALLVVEAVNVEFVAIACKEILLDIKNPDYRAYLSRPIGSLENQYLLNIRGRDGAAGGNGQNGGTVDRIGQPGSPAGAGAAGSAGGSQQLPPVFFFVQKFKFGAGATPSRQYFQMNFSGFRGGEGGVGGRGGTGGRGGNGENGVPDLFGCKEGGGPGGTGGNAGTGGDGGAAGNGGAGGSLFLFAPNSDMFDFSTANIEGGIPGLIGAGGGPGSPGRGGGGAAQVGLCSSKPNGRYGANGTAGQPGEAGQAGARGIQVVRARDNSDLF